MPQHPQRHDALVHLAHLPRSGNDAATVDGRAQSEPGAIFLNQPFAGKLGQPIKRAGALNRAGFLHALRGNRRSGDVPPLKTRFAFAPGMRFQWGHGINAAGGKKKKFALPLPGFFEAAVGAQKIGFHQIVR